MEDESWSSCESVRDRTSIAGEENTSEVENRTVTSIKRMLIVLSNLHEFHIVATPPPRAAFNASWFIDGNTVPWPRNFPGWWECRAKKTVCAH
jgi:hypothetical protein